MAENKTRSTSAPFTPIGIIGGGFGALIAYTILRFRGVAAADILVFSADTSPEKSWVQMAAAIQQKGMRSESVGHFFPTDSPGLATVEAFTTWSMKPLLLAWVDRYHPTLEYFVQHALKVARQARFWQSLQRVRISRIAREGESFVLYDETDRLCGHVRHLILAVGHGQLALPPAITAYQRAYPADRRVIHAFTKKEYLPEETVLVVGDGLSAGTEWMNILEREGSVMALSNRGFIFGQPLNTPRPYFSKRGIVPFRTRPGNQRLTELINATRGTIPGYPYWEKMFKRSRQAGKLQLLQGDLIQVAPVADDRVECLIRLPDGHSFQPLIIDRVVAATGFAPATTHPLIRQLIDDYSLPLTGSYLAVDDNYCIPALSTPESCIAVVGPAAAWALPCADSLTGMKIAARRIAELVLGEESWRPSEVAAKTSRWLRLMTGGQLP